MPEHPFTVIVLIALAFALAAAFGCASTDPEPVAKSEPPPRIREWMDRLTVAHAYDPATGFIVARETVSLPPVLVGAPALREAVAEGERLGLPVVAFATADRCAPCQQYKKDALNDPGVIERLGSGRFIATHIEVDRHPDEAEAFLGSRAIPMTYLVERGVVTAELRGQRSAEDLRRWLDELAGDAE